MRYSRQNKIIELIENNEIDTQEKLAALLKECGFEVTQATISGSLTPPSLKNLSKRCKRLIFLSIS